MKVFEFLPRVPVSHGELIVIGLILLAGVACGELFQRVLRLPRWKERVCWWTSRWA
jgi:hypothetical protein